MDRDLKQRCDDARTAVNTYLAGDPERSQNRLAMTIGMSASTLSAFMRGVYAGAADKVVTKIEQFLALEAQRSAVTVEPDYVMTRQAEIIARTVGMAHAYRTIHVIFGSSGLGKTKSLKHYALQRANVHYIACSPYMRGKVGFLQQIGHTLNIAPGRNMIATFNRVAEEGAAREVLLLLDDAQTLSTDGSPNTTIFECIRALSDAGLAFVLAGNPRLRDRVTLARDMELYQQFASRSRIVELPEAVSRDDVADVIRAVYTGRLGEDELDYLFRLGNGYYGSLWLVVGVLTLGVIQANAQNSRLRVAHLEHAAKHLASGRKSPIKNAKRGKLHGKKIENQTAEPEHAETTRPARAGAA